MGSVLLNHGSKSHLRIIKTPFTFKTHSFVIVFLNSYTTNFSSMSPPAKIVMIKLRCESIEPRDFNSDSLRQAHSASPQFRHSLPGQGPTENGKIFPCGLSVHIVGTQLVCHIYTSWWYDFAPHRNNNHDRCYC
ncbi:hypothetical protein HOLleu_37895 [Holothuria leucospilota]|uniref:Uncharacterized protein n=1 Tax=Holothuria leucospilota TaxID=206669 RepID=A0A9Q0YK62_HOLLE|nr:hypothetical protein HOLleu_37895 [Holothuria leucospilota]